MPKVEPLWYQHTDLVGYTAGLILKADSRSDIALEARRHDTPDATEVLGQPGLESPFGVYSIWARWRQEVILKHGSQDIFLPIGGERDQTSLNGPVIRGALDDEALAGRPR